MHGKFTINVIKTTSIKLIPQLMDMPLLYGLMIISQMKNASGKSTLSSLFSVESAKIVDNWWM
jgi:hypothetical protein